MQPFLMLLLSQNWDNVEDCSQSFVQIYLQTTWTDIFHNFVENVVAIVLYLYAAACIFLLAVESVFYNHGFDFKSGLFFIRFLFLFFLFLQLLDIANFLEYFLKIMINLSITTTQYLQAHKLLLIDISQSSNQPQQLSLVVIVMVI